jgi:hypothetical protein
MKKEIKMSNDSTKPEFFALWSIRQLQVECARLNQVLKDISKTQRTMEVILEDNLRNKDLTK